MDEMPEAGSEPVGGEVDADSAMTQDSSEEVFSDVMIETDPVGGAEPSIDIDDPENSGANLAKWVSWGIVATCCAIVFISLDPLLIFQNTTATGGDMGAHVWGPRFLSDHLLPQFRVSGWTQDWYAGFPAYVFYMVVPSLFVLWLSYGPPIWLSPILLALLAFGVWKLKPRLPDAWMRTAMATVVTATAAITRPAGCTPRTTTTVTPTTTTAAATIRTTEPVAEGGSA